MGKRLTQGISLFLTKEMSDQLHEVSVKKEMSMSQLLRSLVREYLLNQQHGENIQEGNLIK